MMEALWFLIFHINKKLHEIKNKIILFLTRSAPKRLPENRPIVLSLSPTQKGAFPQWIPTGGHNPITHSQQCRPKEEEGDNEGHPCRHINFQPHLQIIKEREEQQPYHQWNPHWKPHSAYHPVRHYLRNYALLCFCAFFFFLLVFIITVIFL